MVTFITSYICSKFILLHLQIVPYIYSIHGKAPPLENIQELFEFFWTSTEMSFLKFQLNVCHVGPSSIRWDMLTHLQILFWNPLLPLLNSSNSFHLSWEKISQSFSSRCFPVVHVPVYVSCLELNTIFQEKYLQLGTHLV